MFDSFDAALNEAVKFVFHAAERGHSAVIDGVADRASGKLHVECSRDCEGCESGLGGALWRVVEYPAVDYREATVATAFLPPIFKGDDSSLRDDEAEELAAFLRSFPAGGCWTECPLSNGETNFALCDVTGLMADCRELRCVLPQAA